MNPLLVPCDTAFFSHTAFWQRMAEKPSTSTRHLRTLRCANPGVLEQRWKTPSVVSEAEQSLSIFLFRQWPWVPLEGQSRTKLLATWTMESISRTVGSRWIPAPASTGSDYTHSGLSYKSFLDQREGKSSLSNNHACGCPPRLGSPSMVLQ